MNKEKQKQFDEKYLRIANIWSENSYAERLKVGCIIVKDNMIISDGFNGTPCGFENMCEDENNKTKPYVLHAEANAITKLAKSHNSSVGATLYVTHSPCIECAKLIIQSGISRVVYMKQYRSNDGIKLLQRANIKVDQLNSYLSKMNNITAEAVDLGLPSGLKWANMNVGATSETDAGLYFQWGDTVGYTIGQLSESETTENGKKYFNWTDYKYCDGSNNTMTKYCDDTDYGKDGFIDSLTTLESSDDAATVNMGKKWRMPTQSEFQELIDNTTNEWTTIDGVNGYKFINKADESKYIFIPAAGGLWGGESFSVGEFGGYWSSSLYEGYCDGAWDLTFYSDFVDANGGDSRDDGFPVRGVVRQ